LPEESLGAVALMGNAAKIMIGKYDRMIECKDLSFLFSPLVYL